MTPEQSRIREAERNAHVYDDKDTLTAYCVLATQAGYRSEADYKIANAYGLNAVEYAEVHKINGTVYVYYIDMQDMVEGVEYDEITDVLADAFPKIPADKWEIDYATT